MPRTYIIDQVLQIDSISIMASEADHYLNDFFRWRLVTEEDIFGPSDIPRDVIAFPNYTTYHNLIGRWVFEVAVVDWDGPHTPYLVWKPFRYWKTKPDDARIDRAKAAALKTSRFFKMCRYCKELNNAGHMCEPTVCQSCASEHLGVVY